MTHKTSHRKLKISVHEPPKTGMSPGTPEGQAAIALPVALAAFIFIKQTTMHLAFYESKIICFTC